MKPIRVQTLASMGIALAASLCLAGCASLGFSRRPPPLSVSEIVASSRAGTPADQIIARMKESGTVYRLSASELAHLHDEGVPDRVLDYMQQTYLASERASQQALDDVRLWTYGYDGYWYGGYPFGWPGDWVAEPDLDRRGDHDD